MNKHLSYILPAFLIAILYFGSKYAYQEFRLLIDVTLPIITIILVALHINVLRFITELNQKLQIKKQFGTYLSPALVAQLQKYPDRLQLGGDERELSIMFTDVRGFTSISEHYGKDVQGLTKIMNRYMTAMTAKILDNNGTLDKYIGDAQMAFWNAPLDEPRHAHMAAKTALEMMGSLDGFNAEVVAEGVPPFGMGLGINTAAVVVGNMGSKQRFDYTCLGDGVNLASRLEGQSKPYGVRIVLGQRTAHLIQDEYFVLELDCIAVKGKKEGVNIYTLLTTNALADTKYSKDKAQHELMIQNYRAQEWKTAIRLANTLKGSFNNAMDYYYDMMIERIADLEKAKLSPTWDGVYVATTK